MRLARSAKGGPARKSPLTSTRYYCMFCKDRNNCNNERIGGCYLTEASMAEEKSGLTAVQEKFILHWGEMGTKWGINRTVAQVHALLYLAAKPLPADEISTTLSVARSNVSTSLRELQGWGIVRVVHVLGDRRDHFETLKDVWEIFRIVAEERKKREIDPTLRVLAECVQDAKGGQGDAHTKERLEAMLEFLTAMTGLFEEILRMPTGALKSVVKLRGKVVTILGSGKKKAG